MRREEETTERFSHLFTRLRKIRIPYRVTFFILGIASTIWFLVRVIPKPSRAGYPCMKAAAPFMSSFVIYLLAISGSAMLFKRSGQFFKKARYILAVVAFVGAMVMFAFSNNIFPERLFATEQSGAVPSDFPANQPMGEEVGIFPGRVVWEWDPDATNEDCTNDYFAPDGPDGFFLAKNNNQEVINRMMDDVVKKLTGTYDVGSAWEMLFVDFNKRKGLGEISYQPGQKIFIKINEGAGGWAFEKSDLSYASWAYSDTYPNAETSAPMAISVLKQLVIDFGVAQEDIYIGDPNAHIFKENYDQMFAVFPNVKYVDKDYSDLGRTRISKSSAPALIWSDKGKEISPDDTKYMWTEMENADYLVNLATLKAHAMAGITLTAKNHFGSHANSGGAWPLHEGLVCNVGNDVLFPARTEYGMYRVLTDIMGHEKLGGNTVLFIVEGLWGGPEAVSKPVKWQMAPFNNDWPSSILAAQDAVALESVCFDLLKTEFKDPSGPAKDRPWYGGVDDHLHQAADSKNWPEGFIYDPEGDGSPMGSMGVHEHWNNENDRQYSRNLGYDYGIELIAPKFLVDNAVNALEAGAVPKIDGEISDLCWAEAQWYAIDETWITWGQEIDSSDFSGRFKMSWSEAENLVYYFVEITDDAFVDGYVWPDDGYYNFDIVEVFIDEDASGGLHALDNDPEWGMNSENAFSYHLNVNAPEDGGSESAFLACDLDGSWAKIDYADHIPELTLRKSGNKYFYEFSMKIFDDSYDNSKPEASRVTLTGNKLMGMSMAYCDNDSPDGERDNFFGSVWVPEEAYNDHWMNSDGYGRVRLIKTGASINHAVEVTGAISDYTVSELNTDLVVHDNLLSVFNDPDGDDLTFSVECDQPNVTLTISGNELKVNASASFEGEANVTVSASDGEFETNTSFKMTAQITGISSGELAPEISCFPNPVDQVVHVQLNLKSVYTGKVSLSLYNMAGMELINRDVDYMSGGSGMLSLDMSGVPGAYYILKVYAGGGIYSLPIYKR